MSRLNWDDRNYEFGLERGVLYLPNTSGVAWNGLISVDETPSEDTERVRYIDGVKTLLQRRPGEFAGKIEAFTYPSTLDSVISSRGRKSFGFSYRITKPNGHLIHLVYNAIISPEGFSRNQSDVSSFVWNFTTKPMSVPTGRLSAHLIVDTAKAYSTTIADFENAIYGSDSLAARLPSPDEVLEIFEENSIVRVIDHGDGTYTVTGPDDVIQMLDATSYSIDWPSAVMIDTDIYTISSL